LVVPRQVLAVRLLERKKGPPLVREVTLDDAFMCGSERDPGVAYSQK